MSRCSTTSRQSFASSCRHFSDGSLKHMKSLCIYCCSRTIFLAQALQIRKPICLQGVAVIVILHRMHWFIKLYVHCSIAIVQTT